MIRYHGVLETLGPPPALKGVLLGMAAAFLILFGWRVLAHPRGFFKTVGVNIIQNNPNRKRAIVSDPQFDPGRVYHKIRKTNRQKSSYAGTRGCQSVRVLRVDILLEYDAIGVKGLKFAG
jgi:hypothetical protein